MCTTRHAAKGTWAITSSGWGLRLRSASGSGGCGDCDANNAELRGVDSLSFVYGDCPYVKGGQLDVGSGESSFTTGAGSVVVSLPWYGGRVSSMTARTLRSFDSDFRGWWVGAEEGGIECLRLTIGGDTDRGGVEDGEGTSAHSDVDSAKNPLPLVDAHGLFPDGSEPAGSRSGVVVMGLGEGEGALVMIESGGKMLKIWSSACGGPYESKGSGTDWSISSMMGSELKRKHERLMLKQEVENLRLSCESIEDVHR